MKTYLIIVALFLSSCAAPRVDSRKITWAEMIKRSEVERIKERESINEGDSTIFIKFPKTFKF